MHSLKGEKVEMNIPFGFPITRDGVSILKTRSRFSVSLTLGILCSVFTGKASADGVLIYLGNDSSLTSPVTVEVRTQSMTSDARFITVENKSDGKSRDSFGWSLDLPEWQGLPDTDMLDKGKNALEGKANKDSAEGLYDRYYTQFLVGDLDAAEEGFLRITRVYPQTAVAYRAQMVIKKIAERRTIRLSSEKQPGIRMPSPSVEQLFSISQYNNQFGDVDTMPEPKETGSMAATTSSKGTRDDFINNIGDRIFFDAGSAELTSKAQELLVAQVQWLKKNPEYKFLIEGHADEEGTSDFNMALSANRAGTVQKFFLKADIDPGRIKVRHYGKSHPVATCKKENCSVQNRRVVTRLLPPPGRPGKKIEGSLSSNFRR